MYRGRCADSRRERSAKIDECDRLSEREHSEPGRIASPVNASCVLKNLGHTGIDVWRAIENAAVLLDRETGCVRQVVVPTGTNWAKAPKSAPA
jgi:hypothetical protein